MRMLHLALLLLRLHLLCHRDAPFEWWLIVTTDRWLSLLHCNFGRWFCQCSANWSLRPRAHKEVTDPMKCPRRWFVSLCENERVFRGHKFVSVCLSRVIISSPRRWMVGELCELQSSQYIYSVVTMNYYDYYACVSEEDHIKSHVFHLFCPLPSTHFHRFCDNLYSLVVKFNFNIVVSAVECDLMGCRVFVIKSNISILRPSMRKSNIKISCRVKLKLAKRRMKRPIFD